jgi:hypothetical protein
VADRVTITVEGDGNGLFRVHGAGQAELFGSGSLAFAHAQRLATRLAEAQAIAHGAKNPRIELHIEKNLLPEARNDDGLLTATVTAEAIGRPVQD